MLLFPDSGEQFNWPDMEIAIGLCSKQTYLDHKAEFCLSAAKTIKVDTVRMSLLEVAEAYLLN